MNALNNKDPKSYIYGPVPSRRLGRSLGIDLVPFKTCTYDCIYCQLGRTTCKTVNRGEWVSIDAVVDQVRDKLNSAPDYITLAGSGEPTLYAHIASLIRRIKEITPTPVAVITNGSLLWKPDVRESLMGADLVIPSLDAGNDHLFRYINRPHPQISFEKMLRGLIDFRQEFKGDCWLEVFLLAGVSTVKVEVQYLADCIKRISPDRIQVNTVARPPCEGFAAAVPEDQLEQIARELYDRVEVIADYVSDCSDLLKPQSRAEEILALLRRRPCSLDDIADGLSLHHQDVVKEMVQFTQDDQVEVKVQKGSLFYTFAQDRGNQR